MPKTSSRERTVDLSMFALSCLLYSHVAQQLLRPETRASPVVTMETTTTCIGDKPCRGRPAISQPFSVALSPPPRLSSMQPAATTTKVMLRQQADCRQWRTHGERRSGLRQWCKLEVRVDSWLGYILG